MSEISDLQERLNESSEQRLNVLRQILQSDLKSWSESFQKFVRGELNTTARGISQRINQFQAEMNQDLICHKAKVESRWWKWLMVTVGLVVCFSLAMLVILSPWLDRRVVSQAAELHRLEKLVADEKKVIELLDSEGIRLHQDSNGLWVLLQPGLRYQALGKWENGQAILLRRR